MEGYVKVGFELPDGPFGSEGIWCKESEDLEAGLYEVANAPWFVYDVSAGDVVRAERDSDDLLCFASLETKGGHATLRVVFEECVAVERQREILTGLPGGEGGESIRYERAMGWMYALDLGPEVVRENYDAVCDYLGRYEREGSLAYEEGDREAVPFSELGAHNTGRNTLRTSGNA